MKKPIPLDPEAAFPNEQRQPADSDISGALGAAYAPLQHMLDRIRAGHPEITPEWKFSPRSGWHLIYSLKQRRLFYLVLKRGDFRFSLLLGDKAIAALKAGPQAKAMPALLKGAKRYPEGTAFSFDRGTLNPSLAAALLEAKIAH
jgi:hypothetical protein